MWTSYLFVTQVENSVLSPHLDLLTHLQISLFVIAVRRQQSSFLRSGLLGKVFLVPFTHQAKLQHSQL